jgi:hypothetical protein
MLRFLLTFVLAQAVGALPALNVTFYQTCIVPDGGPFGATCRAAAACMASPSACRLFNATPFGAAVASASAGGRVRSIKLVSASHVPAQRIGVDTYQLALQFSAVLEDAPQQQKTVSPRSSFLMNCPS